MVLRACSLALVCALGLSLASCGGGGAAGLGGGGGGGGTATATARIVLPKSVAPSSASVVTVQGEADVTASAQTVKVNTGTPTLALIVDKASGKLISLGYLSPGTAEQTLDSEDAATALLFAALGGSNDKGSDRTSLLADIASQAETKALAAAIAGQWNTNAYALDAPDSALTAALSTAADQLSMKVKRPQTTASGESRRSNEFDTGFALSFFRVKGDKDIVGDEIGNGVFSIRNSSTRPSSAFVYTVLHDETAVDPVSPFGDKIDVPYLDQWTPGLAWTNSAGVTPQIQGQDKQTGYFYIVLSPVFGQPDPSDFSEPYWAPELPKWRSELESLRQIVVARIFAELVLDFVGAGGQSFSLDQLKSAITLLDAASSKVHIELENAKGENGLLTSLSQLLVAATGSDDEAKRVLLALKPVAGTNAGFLDPENLSPSKVRAFRAALRMFATFGIVEPLGKYGPKLQQLQRGDKFTILDVRVSRDNLELTPNIGSYFPGESITTKASVRNYEAKDDVSFRWTQVYGSGATMTAGDGKTGYVIETTSDTVTLKTLSSTRGHMDIKCEMFAKNASGVKVKVEEKTASFSQIGDMPLLNNVWARPDGVFRMYVYAILDKKLIGRNRYQGGTYRVERYKGDGTLQARYNYKLADFIGLPGSFGNDPVTNDRKIVDPNKYVLDEGVDAYDYGDRLFLVIQTGQWDINSTQEMIDWTRQTVLNNTALTTVFAFRTSD